MNKNFDVIRKIEEYIGHPGDIVNKAKLFKNNLAKNPVSRAKVINVLLDFEEILDNIKSLFEVLEATPTLSLEMVPNISMDTEEILSLNVWEARVMEKRE